MSLDIENDMIEIADFDPAMAPLLLRHLAHSAWPRLRLVAAISFRKPLISDGAPTVIRRQSCRPGRSK